MGKHQPDWVTAYLRLPHVGAERTTQLQKDMCLSLAGALRDERCGALDARHLRRVIKRWRKPRNVCPAQYRLVLYSDEYDTVSRALRSWREEATPMYQRFRKYLDSGEQAG